EPRLAPSRRPFREPRRQTSAGELPSAGCISQRAWRAPHRTRLSPFRPQSRRVAHLPSEPTETSSDPDLAVHFVSASRSPTRQLGTLARLPPRAEDAPAASEKLLSLSLLLNPAVKPPAPHLTREGYL